jgi:hypothetical protein
VEDAEGFGLGHHGDAEVAVGRGVVEVFAEEAGVGVFDPVDAAAAEAPAFFWGEDAFDERGVAPECGGFDEVAGGSDDVEGADLDVLRGAEKLMRGSGLQIAVTTYHREAHAREMLAYLKSIQPAYRFPALRLVDPPPNPRRWPHPATATPHRPCKSG